MRQFRFLDHTAEIGIVATGDTLSEAFVAAAEGLFSLMVDLSTVQERLTVDVEVSSTDGEALLVDWLNELLFQSEVQGLLFRRFQVEEIGDTRLRARCHGEPIDPERHALHGGVKAATYHMLEVAQGNGYRAQVILDV